jgi:hypothetical protein
MHSEVCVQLHDEAICFCYYMLKIRVHAPWDACRYKMLITTHQHSVAYLFAVLNGSARTQWFVVTKAVCRYPAIANSVEFKQLAVVLTVVLLYQHTQVACRWTARTLYQQ